MGLFKGDALSYDFTVKDIQFKNVSAINNYVTTSLTAEGFSGILFGDIQNGRTVTFSNVKIHDGELYGTCGVGSLVGFVAANNAKVIIDKCEVKCGILTNREGTMKSGYVGGMVGRPVGTVNITNSKVWNTMIKANPGFRGKASIDEIVGDRTSKYNKTVSIDEATVNASTNEEANNMVIIL